MERRREELERGESKGVNLGREKGRDIVTEIKKKKSTVPIWRC